MLKPAFAAAALKHAHLNGIHDGNSVSLLPERQNGLLIVLTSQRVGKSDVLCSGKICSCGYCRLARMDAEMMRSGINGQKEDVRYQ